MCVCQSSGGGAEAGGRTLRFHPGGRRCAVVGYEARGRLGGQAVCGCIPVEKGCLSSTSWRAADEVSGLHFLSRHCLCLHPSLYIHLCVVVVCIYEYVCVVVFACHRYGSGSDAQLHDVLCTHLRNCDSQNNVDQDFILSSFVFRLSPLVSSPPALLFVLQSLTKMVSVYIRRYPKKTH